MFNVLRSLAVAAVILLIMGLIGLRSSAASPLLSEPSSCPSYGGSNSLPPTTIRVRLAGTDTVQQVDFKSYAKNVLPNEWLSDWEQAAFQAGALAVKMYGWNFVINWRHDGLHYVPATGECFDVWNDTRDQVYVAGSSTPATAYAIEQTWNWLLQSGGAIYPAYYKAGCPVNTPGIFTNCQGRTDQCGQWYLGAAPGDDMSQYGSQSCALAGWTWAQIVSAYYFDGGGGHTYGQWHGAMSWGPEPWKPVSVSSSTWKFRNANSCGAPTISPFGFGNPADIKLVGDWDSNGTYTPGVARLVNGILWWYLNNGYDGAAEYSFAYGQAGDIPIVGDWDNNLTVNVGVVRGTTWMLENSNPPQGNHDVELTYGEGGDTPVPGKWKSQSANQATTPGIFRLEGGVVKWYVRDSNTSGPATLIFSYGDYTDRPIAGNYRAGDINTQFGPGVVRDDSTVSCGGMSHNQGWYLRYTPSTGTANVSYKYELIRP